MYIITAQKAFIKIEFNAKFWNIILLITIVLTIIELAVNNAFIMKNIMEGTSNITFDNYSHSSLINKNEYMSLKEKDKSLYRVENKYRSTSNDGMNFNVNTINFCGSTYSKNSYEFLKNMGYSNQHVTVTSDMGNTMAADMLFGIKYIIRPNDLEEYKGYKRQSINENSSVLLNPYSLNLGFTVGDVNFNDIEISKVNPFENYNSIIKVLSKTGRDIYTKHIGIINEDRSNLTKDNVTYKRIDNKRQAKLTYEFEAEKDENAYMYILRR